MSIADEIAQAQAEATAWIGEFDQTCVITDPGDVQPTPGGGTDITGPTSTTAPCRFVWADPTVLQRQFGSSAQLTADTNAIIRLPKGTAARVGWMVAVPSEGVTNAVVRAFVPGTVVARAAVAATQTVGG